MISEVLKTHKMWNKLLCYTINDEKLFNNTVKLGNSQSLRMSFVFPRQAQKKSQLKVITLSLAAAF